MPHGNGMEIIMKFSGKSCAFLTSNEKIVFYGCRGVVKYTDEEIILSLKDTDVLVSGKGLMLSTFFGGEISIMGEIKTLLLGETKGDKTC